jgi:hypothetical protein
MFLSVISERAFRATSGDSMVPPRMTSIAAKGAGETGALTFRSANRTEPNELKSALPISEGTKYLIDSPVIVEETKMCALI